MEEKKPHLTVIQQDDINVVRFADRKILEELSIREIEEELFSLVRSIPEIKLLLNFSGVEHLSSAALGMLINLQKEVGKNGGELKLSDINPQIFEVFKITRLNKLFDIHDTANEALRKF